MTTESDKWMGYDTHVPFLKLPMCPECGASGKDEKGEDTVLEQGYPHNHRHHCYECNVTY